MAARSLSSGVPAGMTMGVLCDRLITLLRRTSKNKRAMRRGLTISYLRECAHRRAGYEDISSVSRKPMFAVLLTENPNAFARSTLCAIAQISVSCHSFACLFTAFSLLGHNQPARGWQQDDRDQPVALHLECSLADLLQMRTGIVHKNDTKGRNLRQKPANFLLADRHVAVAKEQVDRTVYFQFQA